MHPSEINSKSTPSCPSFHAKWSWEASFLYSQTPILELILHGKKQELLLQLEEELLIQAWEKGSVQKLILE